MVLSSATPVQEAIYDVSAVGSPKSENTVRSTAGNAAERKLQYVCTDEKVKMSCLTFMTSTVMNVRFLYLMEFDCWNHSWPQPKNREHVTAETPLFPSDATLICFICHFQLASGSRCNFLSISPQRGSRGTQHWILHFPLCNRVLKFFFIKTPSLINISNWVNQYFNIGFLFRPQAR